MDLTITFLLQVEFATKEMALIQKAALKGDF
jgi:hypothetical protein